MPSKGHRFCRLLAVLAPICFGNGCAGSRLRTGYLPPEARAQRMGPEVDVGRGARILVVEDEGPIRQGICDLLAFRGYAPTGVADGVAGCEAATQGEHDLLLLDVMLPGMDGFSICREARRARPGVAILMLTAKGSEADILEGFQAGADDYVTKPFSVAQLLARVEALLRRAGVSLPKSFMVGGVQIDPGRHSASCGDKRAELSRRDIEVLAYLLEAKGRVVGRAELLREVWGYALVDSVETRAVDMRIAKLRRKLAAVTAQGVIQTVRGAGYRIDG
jgi:DNA-binding response OmpR family regulator